MTRPPGCEGYLVEPADGDGPFIVVSDRAADAYRRDGHTITPLYRHPTDEATVKGLARVLVYHPSVPSNPTWQVAHECPACPGVAIDGANSPRHATHQARAVLAAIRANRIPGVTVTP